VGFQAAGTRGRLIQAGQPVKMYGQYIHIRARIETLEHLSGHADYGEILGWLHKFHKPPGKTFLVHGEPKAAESLRQKVAQELQWDVSVASYLQKVQL
jgi:metallo-beta-lactamase family protein